VQTPCRPRPSRESTRWSQDWGRVAAPGPSRHCRALVSSPLLVRRSATWKLEEEDAGGSPTVAHAAPSNCMRPGPTIPPAPSAVMPCRRDAREARSAFPEAYEDSTPPRLVGVRSHDTRVSIPTPPAGHAPTREGPALGEQTGRGVQFQRSMPALGAISQWKTMALLSVAAAVNSRHRRGASSAALCCPSKKHLTGASPTTSAASSGCGPAKRVARASSSPAGRTARNLT